MADDIRLVIGVEQSGLLKAITSTETLEKKVKKLSAAYARDAVSYGRYNKAIGNLAASTKKSKKELLDYGKALRADEQATKQATLVTKQFAQARKEAIAEDQRRTAAHKQSTLELDRMRKSVDKAYAADQKFTKYKRLLRAEVDKGNLSIKEAARLQLQYRKSVQASNVAVMAQTKASNRMGVVTQQAGYQVSDFIVQVQSGQSAFVAFGQQASQLVGILPLMSSALGVSAGALIAISAGLGIAIPLLTALGLALTATKKSADKAKDSILTLADAQGELEKSTSSYQTKIKMLEFGVDTAAEAKALEELVSLRKDLLAAQSKQGENSLTISKRSRDLQDDEVSRLEKAIAKTEELVEANARVRAEYEAQAALQKSASDLVERNKQAELDNIKSIVAAFKDAEAERQKAREDQEAANKEAEEQIRLQNQALSLQTLELKYTKDSNEYRQEENKIERENLALKLEQAGVDDSHIQSLLIGNMALEAGLRLLRAQRDVTLTMFEGSDAAQRMRKYAGRGTPTGKGQPSTKTTKEPVVKESDLEKLRAQLDLEDALLGKTEARQRVIQALGTDFVKKNADTVAILEAQINKNLELARVEQERIDLANTIGSAMENSLMSMVDGTKSVKDAFRDMARDIIAHLYKVMVVQQMVNALGGFMSGSSNATIAQIGGELQSYDNGGYTGNGPRSGGLDGKGGFMAMLHPRETVTDHTKGQSGGQVVVNQVINVTTGVQQTVRAEIMGLMPQIQEASKAAVLDAKRRGGSFAGAF